MATHYRVSAPRRDTKIIGASNVYEDMSGQPSLRLAASDAPSRERTDRLAALFDAHEDRLYRLARRLSSSADHARDLVQETFLRAATALRSVPAGAASEEAWLVRVLINIRRDEWRKHHVRTRATVFLRTTPAAAGSDAETALMTRRAVWTALDTLAPRRRAIVVMHEIDGMGVEAIAALLGVRVMTVRWHLSIARRDLRRALEPFVGEIR